MKSGRCLALGFLLWLCSTERAVPQERVDKIPQTITNSIGMELRKSWSDSLAFGTSPAVRAGSVLHDHYQNRRLDGPRAA